jgi:predicted RNA-binding Zn-ribbon protein involved in translation (DUF1610 family)
MATITNFRCVDDSGQNVPCDAFGNNVALRCPHCGHPVLAIAREHQRGSDVTNPAECRQCGFKGWIEPTETLIRLRSAAKTY